MSYSFTETYTYTVVDVRKVMDQIRSDMRMAAQSTGLMDAAHADTLMSDVLKYAEKDYMSKVLIYLEDKNGVITEAAEYEISTDARTMTASRSGNMMWPSTPGGRLKVLITTNTKYSLLTTAQQTSFDSTLSSAWPNGTTPTLSHLSRTDDRNYVSNAYGAKKVSYS